MESKAAGIADVKTWCSKRSPEYALILGSGIEFPPKGRGETHNVIPYQNLPGFGKTGVEGHPGELRLISLDGKACVVFAGRRHIYEGLSFGEVTRPVRLVAELGINRLIITNSAGALNPAASAGDLVLLEDFILPFDLEIPDMSGISWEPADSLDEQLAQLIKDAARVEGIPLKMGVYAFMPGPAFETTAEVKWLRGLGADVVGMSTAPEWWLALRLGLAVAGISLVTNVHRHDAPPPSHFEVLDAAKSSGGRLSRILQRVVLGLTRGS